MQVLQLTDWKLSAFYPQVPNYQRSFETGVKLEEMFSPLDAKVPGSVYQPLLDAGILPDPYFEMNSLQCEWVKDRWWVYQTKFTLPDTLYGRHLRLRAGGIDYRGTVSVNGAVLGCHENMYTPFLSNIDEIVKPGNLSQIQIVLEHAPDEMGQFGYTNRTHTQKARFAYKWDFTTRMVQLGLNGPVTIEAFGKFAIDYAKITPQLVGDNAEICCAFEITGFEPGHARLTAGLWDSSGAVVAQGTAEGELVCGGNLMKLNLQVEHPHLWYPNGCGEQPLYELCVQLSDEAGLSDERCDRVGIKALEHLPCERAEADSLPYRLRVNGRDLYIKGVNLVPLDIMYADVSAQRYEETVLLMREANVNLVRVWGGGLIESETFYALCDQYGILVWQEFIQSSSGLNNAPSKEPDFLKKLAETAEEAVKTRRNHVCLAFWCGGNELRCDAGTGPASYEDQNISLLHEIVKRHHPESMMLPTSGSGPTEHLRLDWPGKNHDIHGPWKYEGPERHYTLFNQSDSLLHAEFGVDGMNSTEQIRKIMSPENCRVTSMKENFFWRHHGGEWWDTLERDSSIFGSFKPDDLELFVKCSQFIQAEGLRYILESNRRRAFQNCGSIVWQFNEPWPNVSATNLVDYGMHRKLAYYVLKNAYRGLHPSLQYQRLIYRFGDTFKGKLYLSADSEEEDVSLAVSVLGLDGHILQTLKHERLHLQCHSSQVGMLEFAFPDEPCVRVRLEAKTPQVFSANEYLFLRADSYGVCEKESAAWYYDYISSNRNEP